MLICAYQIDLLFATLKANMSKYLPKHTITNNPETYPDLIIHDNNQPLPSSLSSVQSIAIGTDIKMPFHIMDLLRLIEIKPAQKTYHFRDIIFSPSARKIEYNGQAAKLTETETAILFYILDRGSNGVPEQELLTNVLGYSLNSETSTLNAHIYRLRKKVSSLGIEDIISIIEQRYFIIHSA
jgi:Transcriptional regulatory protein, C terminal